MNTSSERSVMILIALITAVSFTILVGGIFFVWLLIRALGFSADLFNMISAISTALAAAAVFSAGFIAYRELSELTSSRHMEVVDRLFNELNSPENIAARGWIYKNLPAEPQNGPQSLTTEGQLAIKQVLNSLDRVAFMTQSGWIPEDFIMPWMHPMIAKSWEKLAPYVMLERERRNEPYYYEHAERLAHCCLKWRQKNLNEVDIRWVDGAL